jgi:RNA polymerase-binding transcription factor DksA
MRAKPLFVQRVSFPAAPFCPGPRRARNSGQSDARKAAAIMTPFTGIGGSVEEILERKEAELVQVLRRRDGIAIEKSPDQMDEIQYASERDMAIRNADRESSLLRQAVPWASRCVQCQDAADQDLRDTRESLSETLIDAA